MQIDLLLHNGRVYTMDVEQPHAQAIAITGNRIVVVGDDADVTALSSSSRQRVDLEGKAVIPGLIDAHVHFGWHSIAMHGDQVDLDNVPSIAAAVAEISDHTRTIPPGQWIQGGGWNRTIWPGAAFPASADLDTMVPDHPVVMADKSRHATWVNSLALELAGITASSQDPPGGQIVRDESGQPTGILLETASELVYDAIPEPDLEAMINALKAGIAQAHSLGLTGIHDPGHPTVLAALQALRAEGELDLRALVHIPSDGLEHAWKLGLRSGLGDEYMRIGGVKIFADGALGPQTAHMLQPYEGTRDHRGIPTLTAGELDDLVQQAHASGLSVAIHAIGDAANRAALNAIEKASGATAGRQPRASDYQAPALPDRIEHVQLLHPDDLPRLAEMGVIASMQPIHATSDMEMAERCWGDRCAFSYAWRSLLENGASVAFGSDCPIETLAPLPGIHAAVTRRRADGSPGADGWYPAQRVSISEAVHGYTMGVAFASGESHLKGSLAPGKLADLVVLSDDIFRIDPMGILDTHVEMTVFDGKILYQR